MSKYNSVFDLSKGTILIQGAGGGGKGGKNSSTATEDPNTLRSDAKASIILVYSEGETGGVTNSAKDEGLMNIYLDETPIMGPDRSINFGGVLVDQRTGTPDQPVVAGFTETESFHSLGKDLKQAYGPIVQKVTGGAGINAIRIIMQLQGLESIDSKTGSQYGTTVQYQLEVQDLGLGVWEDRGVQTVTGKCTSPYQIAYRLERPAGTAEWQFRVTRVTPDSNSSTMVNGTSVSGWDEIIEAQNTYPNCAYIALAIDVDGFGNGIPKLSARVDGVKVAVPSNYNEDNVGIVGATVYDGIWDGSWKYASTSNPVWHFMELITNERFGLGIDGIYIDKFDLYTKARYCDAVDTAGTFVGVPDLLEGGTPQRRFSIQTQILQQDDALNVLQALASSMRAMAFWGAGVVQLNMDMPKEVTELFTIENVKDGRFVYVSSEMKDRYTAANVTYNDPDDFFRQTVITYEDPEALALYGQRNVLDIVHYGCANRSQAYRYGRWIVDTSLTQTDTVSFTTGIQGGRVRPGDVIAIADPVFQGGKYSGRITYIDGNEMDFDGPVTFDAGKSYTVKIIDTDGVSIWESEQVGPFSETTVTSNLIGFSSTITGDLANHVFVIQGTDIAPRQWMVMAVSEQDDMSYELTAVNYDPNKFLRVEQNVIIDEPPYSKIDLNSMGQPTNIQFEVRGRVNPAVFGGFGSVVQTTNDLVVSWTKPSTGILQYYEVMYRTASGNNLDASGKPTDVTQFRSGGYVKVPEFTLQDIKPGVYEFLITAYNIAGRSGRPADAMYTFNYGGVASSLQPPVNLAVQYTNNGHWFTGQKLTVTWADNPLNLSADGHDYNLNGWYLRIMNPDGGEPGAFDQYIPLSPAGGVYEITYEALTTAFGYETDTFGLLEGPQRRFDVSVQAIDTQGRMSDACREQFVNYAPPVPNNIAVIPFFDYVRVAFDSPNIQVVIGGDGEELSKINDIQGVSIWVSESSQADLNNPPNTYNVLNKPTLQTSGSFFDIPAKPDTKYYITLAQYDTFNDDPRQLNISPQYSVQTTSTTLGNPDPTVPTGLALTTALIVAVDGTLTSTVTATWNANPEAYLATYDVQVSVNGGAYIGSVVTGTTASWAVNPGDLVSVQIRARSIDNMISGYSDPVSIVAAVNSTPPAPLTDLKVTAALHTAFLTWTNPTDRDFDHVDIESSTTVDFAVVVDYHTSSNSFTRTDMATGDTLYFRARPVNTSGVANQWQTFAPITATPVISTDVAAGAINATAFANDIEPIGIYTVLPTTRANTYVTVGGKLYKWNGTAYVSAVDAGDLTGQIVSTQISDGAILTPKLAAGAVTTDTLDANAVTTAKIAAGAVKAGQIDAGAVHTTNLAVGNGNNVIWNSDFLLGAKSVSYYTERLSGGGSAPLLTDSMVYDTVDGRNLGNATLSINSDHSDAAFRLHMQYVYTSSASQSGSSYNSDIPVVGGMTYEASVYVATTGGAAYMTVTFRRSGTPAPLVVTSNLVSGGFTNPVSASQRCSILTQAPADAVSATIDIFQNYNGSASPCHIRLYGLMFAQGFANQTELSAYSPNGMTIIDGSGVRTNSLDATKITGGTITTDKLSAGNIDASVLRAGSTLSSTIMVGSNTPQSLDTLLTWANDPANKVNGGQTLINPGLILIAGGTKLSDWRSGTDATKINGGAISANSVKTNSLTVGNRNLVFTGCTFQATTTSQKLAWTAGSISYTADDGSTQTAAISAGSVNWNGTVTVGWIKGATSLTAYNDSNGGYRAGTTNADFVAMANYAGSNLLNVTYGGTVIDGSNIATGTITANNIQAATLTGALMSTSELIVTTSAQINTGIIQTAHIHDAAITNAKIAGVIQSDNFVWGPSQWAGWQLDKTLNGTLRINNIEIRDSSGNLVLSAGGRITASSISGLGSLATQSSVSAGQVSGLGSLATQNSVSAGQVSGLGSLATANFVNYTQVNGLGSVALLNQVDYNSLANKPTISGATTSLAWNSITDKPSTFAADWYNMSSKPYFGNFSALDLLNSSNITSYVAGQAIGTALIGDAAIDNGKIANLVVNNIKIANNSICNGHGGETAMAYGGPSVPLFSYGNGYMIVTHVWSGIWGGSPNGNNPTGAVPHNDSCLILRCNGNEVARWGLNSAMNTGGTEGGGWNSNRGGPQTTIWVNPNPPAGYNVWNMSLFCPTDYGDFSDTGAGYLSVAEHSK